MPAVSKGDGMRGLAVFISDIRNCELMTGAWGSRGDRAEGAGKRGGVLSGRTRMVRVDVAGGGGGNRATG